MTYEEAKEYMEKKRRCSSTDFKSCKKYEVCKNCPNDYDYKILQEVEHIAIEALEKQIPKKPLDITKYENGVAKRYENCSVVKCANCNGRLKMKSRGHYYDKCGQKIDWEEGAEE